MGLHFDVKSDINLSGSRIIEIKPNLTRVTPYHFKYGGSLNICKNKYNYLVSFDSKS